MHKDDCICKLNFTVYSYIYNEIFKYNNYFSDIKF